MYTILKVSGSSFTPYFCYLGLRRGPTRTKGTSGSVTRSSNSSLVTQVLILEVGVPLDVSK